MGWRKLGLVWGPDGSKRWARSHGMGPTPLRLNPDVIRVFVTCLDDRGRGRPGYVDVAARDPTRVLGESQDPLLDIGEPGAFDDNGLMATCVLEVEPGILFMYYAGFELCTQVRYRILTGLAISTDAGATFRRQQRVPILERSDVERLFRCGPFVRKEGAVFRMWYVGGSHWTEIGGKAMPVYDLRYQESADGVVWGSRGEVVMPITGDDEHGFGRPWVTASPSGGYRMHYSIRRKSLAAYRLGYAESPDGVAWRRCDDCQVLDVSPGSFDSDAVMYSAVITPGDNTYCFYNGNGFGQRGFGVAVWED